MWLATIQFRCERGTRLMISTCPSSASLIDTPGNNLHRGFADVSCSSLSIAIIAQRADALCRVRVDGVGDVDFQFSSPSASVASERGARSFLVVAQSKSIAGRGARGHRADEGPNHFPARRADRLSGRTAKSDSIH